MNTYIVDPMLIYWLDTIPKIGGALLFGFWLLLAMLGAYWLTILICVGNVSMFPDVSDSERAILEKTARTRRLTPLILAGIMLVGIAGTFVPSEETLYKMLVAKYATVENVQAATQSGKKLVEFLTDQIEEIKEGK